VARELAFERVQRAARGGIPRKLGGLAAAVGAQAFAQRRVA
jgi:hypothetical protein